MRPPGPEVTPPSQDPAPETDDLSVVPPQDGFRKVYFGEIADPLVPYHPDPPEAPEDELTQAALADEASVLNESAHEQPSLWRPIFLFLLAALALGYIFWRR